MTRNREVGNGGGGTPMSARGAKRPGRQPWLLHRQPL